MQLEVVILHKCSTENFNEASSGGHNTNFED